MFCLAKIIIFSVIFCCIRCFLAKILAVFYIMQSVGNGLLLLCLTLFLEAESEKQEHRKGVTGKDKPNGVPVANLKEVAAHLFHIGIMVYHRLCHKHAEGCTEAVVIIINSPCALLRISGFVLWSTNSAPEMLKKSNATP